MADPNVIYGGDYEGSQELNYASLGESIIENLKKNGTRRNFINGITGESQGYDEILDKTIKVAKSLHNIGVTDKDIIAIISENRHEFIPIAFGAICLNAAVAPINLTYTELEMKHALEISKPKVIFASKAAIKNVASFCKQLNFVQHIILIDQDDQKLDREISMDFKRFIQIGSKAPLDVFEYVKQKVNIQDKTVVIFMSSGTTGAPKGVEITQKNIMAIFQAVRDRIPDYKNLCERLALLSVAPWFHVLGFVNTLACIVIGESLLVFIPKFDPEIYLSCIEKYRIVSIIVAPPIVVFLAKTPLLPKYDLSSLKVIHCGAAPLSHETEQELKKRFKTKILVLQGYGLSETTYGILGADPSSKPGSNGKVARGCYVKIIDEKGNSLGPNQRGELCFKGSINMKGYINNPKATAEAIDKEGWLHTGDLAYYDEDREFFIVDRLKELIKYKAFQVAPAEIEGLLLSNPKIKDAGVIGIPDETAGELPLAFVVKQPGADLTERDVQEFVSKSLSNTKWLRGGVKFIDEIPKNPSGKILRRELKDMYKSMRAKL